MRNIHLSARFKGVYREDFYEILEDAIRELIINAVVHRSYLEYGNIQVAIFDDRLEITSPGKLPMGQSIDKMILGFSKIRNEALANAFAYMGYIEHWGSGIPRIAKIIKKAGLEPMVFLDSDTDLRICVKRKVQIRGDENGTVNVGVSDGVNQKILDEMKENSSITLVQIAQKFELNH